MRSAGCIRRSARAVALADAEMSTADEHSVALLAAAAAAADAVGGRLPFVPVAQPEEIPALAARGHSAVDVEPVNSLLVAFAYGHGTASVLLLIY